MKILIIDIDSKTTNIALKKVEKYHLDRGDEVVWNNELMAYVSDKIYVSCIFDWNREKAKYWEAFPQATIGGSGYSLTKTLPAEIKKTKPKINIGFTTRGCIRKCSFCIVPEKEGNIKAVADIYDFWDGKSKDIVLLDNNILALKKHFIKICLQLRKEELKVDFNQGLDCRLIRKDIVKELATLKHHEYRFAFDSLDYEKAVKKTISLMPSRSFWYVYCDEDFDNAMKRILILRDLKQRPYLMRDRKVKGIIKFNILANWVNCMGALTVMDFEAYKKYYKNRNLYWLRNKNHYFNF